MKKDNAPNHLEMLLKQGTLSRRSMLKLLSAGAVASSGIIGFPDLAIAAEQPVKGGKMRVALSTSSASDTLDPARSNNSADYTRQFMFLNGLTEIDNELVAKPALAADFHSDDGITWQFNLRQGVNFHNGKALTAEDVVWSLLRHKDPAVASSAFSLAQQFKTIIATNPQQVTIVLDGSNFDLPLMLAMPYFLIVPANTTNFAKGIGTGPFLCKTFTPGLQTIGTRNPHYWKAGLPHLEEVELLGITDQAARVNGLLAGELQMCSSISAGYAKQINASGGRCKVLETKSGMYSDLIIRTDIAPGNHPDFVMAMKYLQPRELLIKTALQGYGTVANDTPVPLGTRCITLT